MQFAVHPIGVLFSSVFTCARSYLADAWSTCFRFAESVIEHGRACVVRSEHSLVQETCSPCSTQSPPSARRGLLRIQATRSDARSYLIRSSSLIRLDIYVLCANRSLSLCYPYSILQHARRAVGGDWVLYATEELVDTIRTQMSSLSMPNF